jgi:hypothetical protein
MSHAAVVRYTTRSEHAEDNERLIRAVFAQLAEQAPAGMRYSAIRLEDGVSFVHVAVFDTDDNPLARLPAFDAFVSGIAGRCAEGPVPATGSVIGSYQP